MRAMGPTEWFPPDCRAHWGIEATVESTNKFLTHFGSKSLLGVQYQMSVELLTIELRLGIQPFLLDYKLQAVRELGHALPHERALGSDA